MAPPRLSPFWTALSGATGAYLLFLIAMLIATAAYCTPADIKEALNAEEIRYSIGLSLKTCTITALLAVVLAVPVGYLLARSSFPGKSIVEAALDIPIVLPPMVIGLCLLIFFQSNWGGWLEDGFAVIARAIAGVFQKGPIPDANHYRFTYTVFGIVLAQFVIGAAFAIRTMRGVFDHISSRPEEVAMTLGCHRAQAVWLVTLPSATKGMWAAGSVAWARSLGEFGPILVFAGATRMKTEVLPTSVWLELSVGNLESAVAVSMVMVTMAMMVLVGVRWAGEQA